MESARRLPVRHPSPWPRLPAAQLIERSDPRPYTDHRYYPAMIKLASPNLFSGLEHVIQPDHALARYTWYRIGGPARFFATPGNEEELAEIVRRCHDANLPLYFLGLGANVLISDAGVDGVVVRLSDPHWMEAALFGNQVICGAGADVAKLVVKTCRAGLGGLECMAGIPGTVGGAVRMNAGGKFGDFGSSVTHVRLMDTYGHISNYTRDQVHFSYRHADLPAPYILGATLELDEQDPEAVSKRMREIWMYKRNSQPLNAKSAGCVFKNPDPAASGNRSAGALIDQAGLKGAAVGGAEVSSIHANFFVAKPGCKADDLLTLIDTVKDKVEQQFGIALETEVRVWR